jgi:hypothetical protein
MHVTAAKSHRHASNVGLHLLASTFVDDLPVVLSSAELIGNSSEGLASENFHLVQAALRALAVALRCVLDCFIRSAPLVQAALLPVLHELDTRASKRSILGGAALADLFDKPRELPLVSLVCGNDLGHHGLREDVCDFLH